MTLSIILAIVNSICLIINIVNAHYWIIPLNVLAIILCLVNVKYNT